MAQVFVSYSSKDHNIANLAVALLEERGHRCWVAPRDIVPGTEWGQAIIDGINTADVFLLVFSNNANTSPQILREVERAVNRGLPIIPFRIEDVMPQGSLEYFMSVPHWFDALSPPVEGHLDRLANVIDQLVSDPASAREYRGAPARGLGGINWNNGLLRALVGGAGLALLLLAAWLGGIAPPDSPAGWLAALGAVGVAGLAGARGRAELFARPALRAPLLALLVAAAAAYGWAYSNSVIEGLGGEPLVRGSVCTPDAKLIFEGQCPDLPAEALVDAAYDETLLWTTASIGQNALILALAWGIMAAAAAALIAGWLGASRPIKRDQ